MEIRAEPFDGSRPVGQFYAACIIIVGLVLVLLGGIPAIQTSLFMGASLGGILSNLGFAVVVLASFQWIYEYRYRERFFRDIRAQIISDQSINDSGIVRVYPRSKEISFSRLIKEATQIDIGVAYSERFLKDYFPDLKSNTSAKIRLYCVDAADEKLLDVIAYANGRDVSSIKSHLATLEAIAKELGDAGCQISTIHIHSFPRYAFFRFDKKRTFFVPSTFVSRHAVLPTLELDATGCWSDLVSDCIAVADRGET